jgi:hypothetical protein
VPAQVAGTELERIRTSHGGNLAPSAVVEESRPEEAPLHRCFEWDETKAAQRWNEHQARQVIGSIVEVHITEGPPETIKSTIAFVRMEPDEGGQGYQRTAEVVADDELRGRMLHDALIYLQGAQKRFAHLSELKEVFDAIDRAIADAEQPKKARSKRGKDRPRHEQRDAV